MVFRGSSLSLTQLRHYSENYPDLCNILSLSRLSLVLYEIDFNTQDMDES